MDTKQVVDYLTIIKEPMDLGLMTDRYVHSSTLSALQGYKDRVARVCRRQVEQALLQDARDVRARLLPHRQQLQDVQQQGDVVLPMRRGNTRQVRITDKTDHVT